MIYVTIVTASFRFMHMISESLSNSEDIRITHVLPSELTKIPKNTHVVVTTQSEKKGLEKTRLFIPKSFNFTYLYSNILAIVNNKHSFNTVTIGIDPGKTVGFAVFTDNHILKTNTYFNAIDVVKEIISIFFNVESNNFEVKIGTGGGDISEEIHRRLKKVFQNKIDINIISEEYTTKNIKKVLPTVHNKHIASAILIAKREIYTPN